ncbi:MAG: hypothetical protein EU539_02055 [Promethearchaeota archaeon]|nr:MAG: hypothetical protein EU539_02055 [Candidatus Lokiarchaeota archaeon]
MALEPIDILNGTFSIVCVVISTIVGIIIASRFFKYKQRTLLLVGITWIGLFSPWWPSSIAFILALFTGRGLGAQEYILIGNIVAPVMLLIWIIAFTDLKFKEQQKIIIGIYIIIGVLYEVFFLYFLVTNPSSLGELSGILDVTYRGLVLYFAIFIVINMFITGVLFGHDSLNSPNPETKLKGYFLIAAFISWCIGAVMDAALPLNTITLTIARLILISSAVEFYFGFILPDFIKKYFIKQV